MIQFSHNDEVKHIACQILKHIYDNPHNKDSIHGICEWWLHHERNKLAINTVSQAIKLLLSRKLIIEQQYVGSPKIYSINPSQKSEVLNLIKLEAKYSHELKN